ncbi:SDR family NAD(P)-dependent oxidoreductase [Streptomyces sp. NPDC050560]|uniref:SDR family NAD(P)-dependent oxidoreductase n=1 Tax=Streptomyces sp. NPDC050560 TaxID=3365630 RepID=UPI003794B0F9
MPGDRTWFITGASRGFGRVWAEAALERGDRVVATARSAGPLGDLASAYGDAVLPLSLDVTRRDDVFEAVERGSRHFGGLDVVLTAAGYGLFGAVEEVSDREARHNVETNVFGTLAVVQAALPILRARGHGHFLLVSSMGGIVAGPMFFQPAKWAVEALGESLSQEVAPFGVHVTLIEPGAYRTTFFTDTSSRRAAPIPAYDQARNALATMSAGLPQGDPAATPPALFAVLDAERPPLRLILGSRSLPLFRRVYEDRLAEWNEWAAVSNAAQGRPAAADTAGRDTR